MRFRRIAVFVFLLFVPTTVAPTVRAGEAEQASAPAAAEQDAPKPQQAPAQQIDDGATSADADATGSPAASVADETAESGKDTASPDSGAETPDIEQADDAQSAADETVVTPDAGEAEQSQTVVVAEADGETSTTVSTRPLLPPEAFLAYLMDAPTDNEARRERLLEFFRLGGATEADLDSHEFRDGTSTGRNILCRVRGARPGRGVIVLGAHTDTVDGSPGVLDDWSGCVMLAAVHALVRASEPQHDFLFIGFDGEEHGLVGSSAYVADLSRAEIRNIHAMINLECYGMIYPRAWSNISADDLEILYMETAREVGVYAERERLFGYKVDSVAFSQVGVPAITLHGITDYNLSVINGPLDDGSFLHDDVFRNTWRAISEFVVRVDALDRPLSARNAEERFRQVDSVIGRCRVHHPAAKGKGVLLGRLPHDSAEYRAGLREGDVIVMAKGLPVRTWRELRDQLFTLARGETVRIAATPLSTFRRDASEGDDDAPVLRLREVTVRY